MADSAQDSVSVRMGLFALVGRRLTGSIRQRMKKAAIIAVVVVGALVFLFQKITAITDPYVVRSIAVLPAPSDAKIGHTVDIATRTLSIVSRKEVVVVSDPGASFKYEDLWIVESQRENGSNDLMLYRTELPKFAVAEHIHLMGSDMPPKIAKFASGDHRR